MSACGKWAWHHPEKGLSVFHCGSGSCGKPKCRDLFWSRRVRLITALIKEFGLIRFFTLTLDRCKIPKEVDPWDYIHHPWSKMRKRLKRLSAAFKFVAILEAHKTKKYPHIHGFTNLWLPQVEWSIMWNECKGGKIVWIEQVKDGDVSSYVSKELEVAKYVGKENLTQAYKQKRGHRTLWRSEGIRAKYELISSPDWTIIKQEVFTEEGELNNFWTKEGCVWQPNGIRKERPGENTQHLS